MSRVLTEVRRRLRGLVDPGQRAANRMIDAAGQGLGGMAFVWLWPDANVDALMAEVDEEIRRAPGGNLGADDFLMVIRVWGRMAGDGEAIVDSLEGRPLLREYRLGGFDRYYDWNHGQMKARARDILQAHIPTPDAPYVTIGVLSLGAMVVELLKQGRISLRP